MSEYSLPVQYEGQFCYEIDLRIDFSNFLEILEANKLIKAQKICIVSDSNVAKIYLNKIENILRKKFETVISFVFEAGEANKNTETVGKLYEHLIINHFDRKDFLIALGGGVVGDLTGFAAATYMRGISFIQIPTSLLAQVDSSIGGKTGVDHMQYKNMVGAFHQPKLVYMSMEVFKSLPDKQFFNGMGEIIKHGLIKKADYYESLRANKDQILKKDPTDLMHMIAKSCEIKREVVQNDPKEQGERALLNFGHTIGHAVEKLSDFNLYHGECVSLGIVAASYMSYQKGYLTMDEVKNIEDVLASYMLPIRIPKELDMNADAILAATKSDKKMDGKKIKFILLRSIGDAFIDDSITEEEMLEGINYIL